MLLWWFGQHYLRLKDAKKSLSFATIDKYLLFLNLLEI